MKIKEEDKNLNYWKKNCEENLIHTPISVIRYIGELEKAVNNGVLDDVIVSGKDCKIPMREFNSDKCLICGKKFNEH